jgi:hypothetical protein
MVITIKKGMTKEEIDELLKQLPVSTTNLVTDKNPINMEKYKGTLSLKGDVVLTQRRMRDDRNYSY